MKFTPLHSVILVLCVSLLACDQHQAFPESETKNFSTNYTFPESFLFGLATAPGHAEDNLDDTWSDFAKAGFVAAFQNETNPFDRLNFWTRPDIEINEAAKTGIQIYRMGIDWQRLAPHLPGSNMCPQFPGNLCPEGIQDLDAWKYYKNQHFEMLKNRKLKIMLTLFHHSAPKWFLEKGGWSHKDSVQHFLGFVDSLLVHMGKSKISIDYWTTLNEPVLFSLMTHIVKAWPSPDSKPGVDWGKILDTLSGNWLFPEHKRAVENMIQAHNQAYDLIKKHRPTQEKVGYAQNIGVYSPANPNNPIIS